MSGRAKPGFVGIVAAPVRREGEGVVLVGLGCAGGLVRPVARADPSTRSGNGRYQSSRKATAMTYRGTGKGWLSTGRRRRKLAQDRLSFVGRRIVRLVR